VLLIECSWVHQPSSEHTMNTVLWFKYENYLMRICALFIIIPLSQKTKQAQFKSTLLTRGLNAPKHYFYPTVRRLKKELRGGKRSSENNVDSSVCIKYKPYNWISCNLWTVFFQGKYLNSILVTFFTFHSLWSDCEPMWGLVGYFIIKTIEQSETWVAIHLVVWLWN